MSVEKEDIKIILSAESKKQMVKDAEEYIEHTGSCDTPNINSKHDFMMGYLKMNEHATQQNAELLEALKKLTTQVMQDCSISSDPKLLDLCMVMQEAMQVVRKYTNQG